MCAELRLLPNFLYDITAFGQRSHKCKVMGKWTIATPKVLLAFRCNYQLTLSVIVAGYNVTTFHSQLIFYTIIFNHDFT